MVEKDPSPWTVVNDYTKTVVTLAAALLAFTATFARDLAANSSGPFLLFISWSLLTISIALALFSAGRLTGFLRGTRHSANSFLVSANLSYFALFAGILVFLILAVVATATRDQNTEPIRAVAVARQFLPHVDDALSGPVALREINWNPNTSRWELSFDVNGSIVRIAVEARTMRIVQLLK